MASKAEALALYEAINSLDLEGVEKASAYSGRAMYGKHCVAMVIPNFWALVEFGAALGRIEDENGDSPLSVGDVARSMRSDSLGHDMIVYWPAYEWDSATMKDSSMSDAEDDES